MAVVSEILDPAALTPAARQALADALYETHRRIFAGVDRAAFGAYVVDSPARRTRIQVFRDRGEVVGYAAFHEFESTLDGRSCAVVRGEVGLLPKYRGRTRAGAFLIRQSLRTVLRGWGRPTFALVCAVHPASYRTIARHCDRMWPRWDTPTPSSVDALMRSLAGDFGLDPVGDPGAGVYHVGWQTRQSAHEVDRWARCTHPASRFFVSRNPGYGRGHGLLTLIPLGPAALLRAAARLARRALARMWGGGRPLASLGEGTDSAA